MSDRPKPNWWLFSRVSLMPFGGLALFALSSGVWLRALGVATAVVGSWLTMRRLTGRISERSLAWVLLDTSVLLLAAYVALRFDLSGVALWVLIGVPAAASDAIATALAGVRQTTDDDEVGPGAEITPAQLAQAEREVRASRESDTSW